MFKKCYQRITPHQAKSPGELYRLFQYHAIRRLHTFLRNIEKAETPNSFL